MKKYQIFLTKNRIYIVTLGVIIVTYVILSLRLLDYPLTDGEAQRDYLIIHTMVEKHEFPLTGRNSGLYPLRNSPFEYYLFYPFLLFSDSFTTYQVVNVFLQGINIASIALLGSILFSPTAGVLAAGLFAASTSALIQSSYPWAPFFATPFVHVSLATWMLFRRSKKYVWLFVSVASMIAALALHYAVLALLPVYIALTIYTLYTYHASWKKLACLLVVSFSSYILFFGSTVAILIPDLVSFIKHHSIQPNIAGSVLLTPRIFFERFLMVIHMFFESLFAKLYTPGITRDKLVFAMLVVLTIFYSAKKANWSSKKRFAMTTSMGFIVSMLLFITPLNPFTFDLMVYVVPVLGLFFIILAHLLLTALPNNTRGRILKTLCVVGLVSVFYQKNIIGMVRGPQKQNEQVALQAVHTIQSEMDASQTTAHPITPGTMQIKYYRYDGHTDSSESNPYTSLILVPLLPPQYRAPTRLTTQDIGYEVFHTDDTIFVVCAGFSSQEEEKHACLDPFGKEYPHHHVVKTMFTREPLSLYLAQKLP